MALEHHDELGLPWDDWSDGRVHRLVKGRDFLQSSEVLEEAAENAARRLDKVARCVTEVRFRNVFMWVQFVDSEITLGEPCRCGSFDLLRVSTRFAECASCGSTLAVREPKERPEDGPAASSDGDDALITTLLSGQPLRPKGRAGRPRDLRTDPARLGTLRSIVLFSAERDHERERLYGHALTAAGGRKCLLVVDVARRDGERVQDPAYPGGVVHVARSMPASPFGQLIDLDRFPARPPDLVIEDPLAGLGDAGANGHVEEFPWLDAPPSRLDAFAGVTLFPKRGRPGGSAEHLFGYGRGPEGDPVLLAVRYRLRNGQRVDDPEHPGEQIHGVRWVPLTPFGPVVDVDALVSGKARRARETG